MGAPTIRAAEPRDLPALVRIYNHYVRSTPITFDIGEFTVEQKRPWIEGFDTSGPYRLFVAETADGVVGWASSHQFRTRPAYATSVETSIYLDAAVVGRGLGRHLYDAVFEALAAHGSIHRVYAGITIPNPTSVAFHERFGFRLVGTFREVGFKFDKYWDVSWYEKEMPHARAT